VKAGIFLGIRSSKMWLPLASSWSSSWVLIVWLAAQAAGSA